MTNEQNQRSDYPCLLSLSHHPYPIHQQILTFSLKISISLFLTFLNHISPEQHISHSDYSNNHNLNLTHHKEGQNTLHQYESQRLSLSAYTFQCLIVSFRVKALQWSWKVGIIPLWTSNPQPSLLTTSLKWRCLLGIL